VDVSEFPCAVYDRFRHRVPIVRSIDFLSQPIPSRSFSEYSESRVLVCAIAAFGNFCLSGAAFTVVCMHSPFLRDWSALFHCSCQWTRTSTSFRLLGFSIGRRLFSGHSHLGMEYISTFSPCRLTRSLQRKWRAHAGSCVCFFRAFRVVGAALTATSLSSIVRRKYGIAR
jgi:hypothetical protein